jgi:hypothetical protein
MDIKQEIERLQEFIGIVNQKAWQKSALAALESAFYFVSVSDSTISLQDIVRDLLHTFKITYIEKDITGLIQRIAEAVKEWERKKKNRSNGGDAQGLSVPMNSMNFSMGNVTNYLDPETGVEEVHSGLIFLLAFLIVVLSYVVYYRILDFVPSVYEKILDGIDLMRSGAGRIFRLRSNARVGEFLDLELAPSDPVAGEGPPMQITGRVTTREDAPSDAIELEIPGQVPEGEDRGSGGGEEGAAPLTVKGAATIASMSALVLACAAVGSIGPA